MAALFPRADLFSPTFRPAKIPRAGNPEKLLYKRATNEQPPFDVADMNAYWNDQAWTAIKQAPGAWLKLMGRKTYYLFNDFDQYNNKTYTNGIRSNRRGCARNFLDWGIRANFGGGRGGAGIMGGARNRRRKNFNERCWQWNSAGVLRLRGGRVGLLRQRHGYSGCR